MAELKTSKYGDIYIRKDGSVIPLWNEPSVADTLYASGLVASDGTAVLFYQDSGGDIRRKTGNHLLAPSGVSTAGTVVLNEVAYEVVYPVFLVDGSNIHMWHTRFTGATDYDEVYYRFSSDNGANWSAETLVLSLGSGGTYDDAEIRPCGATFKYVDGVIDADTIWLFASVHDGTTARKLAIYEIDVSGGVNTTEAANILNYSRHASNPMIEADAFSAVTYAEGRYHLWTGRTGAQDILYHWSEDGLSWSISLVPSDADRVFTVGISSTLDDANIRPNPSPFFFDGNYYLWYSGYEGTNWRTFLAVGEKPDKLYKVGGAYNLISTAVEDVYYASGDLTYQNNSEHSHVPDRMGPGALIAAPFAPFDASFTFKLQEIGNNGVADSNRSDSISLFNYLTNPSPSVNQGPTFEAGDPNRINIMYRMYDNSNVDEQFIMFLNCVVHDWAVAESEEGNDVTVPFTCYGGSHPIIGEAP